MKKIKLYLCAAALTALGCHNKPTEAEQMDATIKRSQDFTTQFYSKLKQKDYKGTYSMFGELFYKKSDTIQLQHVFDSTTALMGDIVEVKLDNSANEFMEDHAEIRLFYKVKRTKFDTEESICVVKRNNEMSLAFYFINSQSYLMEQSRKAIERTTFIQQ